MNPTDSLMTFKAKRGTLGILLFLWFGSLFAFLLARHHEVTLNAWFVASLFITLSLFSLLEFFLFVLIRKISKTGLDILELSVNEDSVLLDSLICSKSFVKIKRVDAFWIATGDEVKNRLGIRKAEYDKSSNRFLIESKYYEGETLHVKPLCNVPFFPFSFWADFKITPKHFSQYYRKDHKNLNRIGENHG